MGKRFYYGKFLLQSMTSNLDSTQKLPFKVFTFSFLNPEFSPLNPQHEKLVQTALSMKPMLLSFIGKAVPPSDREDVFQDTLLALHTANSKNPIENLTTYIWTAARNQIKKYHREQSAQKRRTKEVPLEDDLDSESSWPSPFEMLVSADLEIHLKHCVREQSAERRYLLHLVLKRGFILQKAAEILDRPLGTIKRQLHETRESLKRCLQKWGLDV